MTIKLLPNQIPQLWDAIKFAVTQVNGQSDLNKLLWLLLNDKSQCFIRMDDNRVLQALAITSIVIDSFTGTKSLNIDALYSFQVVNNGQWKEDAEFVRDFALAAGCKKIIAQTSNPRVIALLTSVNFVENFRTFSVEI